MLSPKTYLRSGIRPSSNHMSDSDETISRKGQLTGALRRVILLRETGPKSAAWHRARMQTIWRLHHLIDQAGAEELAPCSEHKTDTSTAAQQANQVEG